MKKLNLCTLILVLVITSVLLSEERHLIVMPEEFAEQAEELAEFFFEEYGIARELHEINQIIEGTEDPAQALHCYLEAYFTQPGVDMEGSSVLLLGCGTRDWWSGSERNKIPIISNNNLISDSEFVNFDENYGGEVAIGRIPAVNNDSLASYLETYYDYMGGSEQGLWQRKMLFTADDEMHSGIIEGCECDGMNHSAQADVLVSSVSSNYLKNKVYGIDYDLDENGEKSEAKQDILDYLNNGIGLWTYTGHGSYNIFGDECYFEQEDVSQLSNNNNRCFLFAATCNTGDFSQEFMCMGEQLLFNQTGGIIAGVLPAGSTSPENNTLLGCYLLSLLYDEDMSWGDALRLSRIESGASIFNCMKYNLLGDPLGKINDGISDALNLEPDVDILIPGEEILLGWNCGTAYEEVTFAIQEASSYIEYSNTLDDITYTYSGYRPGNIVYMQVASVTEGRAEVEGIFPTESNTGDDGRIICYAEDLEYNSEFRFSDYIQIGACDNVEDELVEIPNLSNYPNPFNPNTVIRYFVSENEKTMLTIYNIKGERVKTLVNSKESEGWHEVEWNGKDYSGKASSSGVYLLKMTNGKVQQIGKMSLLK